MTDLRQRLESFCEGFDGAAPPVRIDEVFEERLGGEAVRLVQPRLRVRRPLPGWAVAVIAAVLVVVMATIGFLFARGSDGFLFVAATPETTEPVLLDAGSGFDAAAALITDDWPGGYPERLGNGTWITVVSDWQAGAVTPTTVWILEETGRWTPHEVAELRAVPLDGGYVRGGLLWAWVFHTSEVWNSADGVTWRLVDWGSAAPPVEPPRRLARTGETILMGGGDGGALYVSSDAGRSFTASTPFPGTLRHLWSTGEGFRAIVDSADAAGTIDLWRSGDGMGWEEMGRVSGLGDANLSWRSALSISSEALLLSDLDGPGSACDGDVYRSVDGGRIWQALDIVEWLTDGGPPFLQPACWSVASADGEWMLVGGYAAWGPPRAGVWGSRNGVDWYRIGSALAPHIGGNPAVGDPTAVTSEP